MTNIRPAIFIILVLFLLSSPITTAYAQSAVGYINAAGVKLLERPSADAKIIREFRKGDRIKYASSKEPLKPESWIQITVFRMNVQGYVLAKYITEGTIDSRF